MSKLRAVRFVYKKASPLYISCIASTTLSSIRYLHAVNEGVLSKNNFHLQSIVARLVFFWNHTLGLCYVQPLFVIPFDPNFFSTRIYVVLMLCSMAVFCLFTFISSIKQVIRLCMLLISTMLSVCYSKRVALLSRSEMDRKLSKLCSVQFLYRKKPSTLIFE